MGILICIIAFLGYLQYGHEEQAVNTMVSTSGAFYKQEFDVIANKLFILDKEKYAEELIEKAVKNKYRNVRFSYDITGKPNEMIISVYNTEWHYNPIKHWGGEKQLKKQKEHDSRKARICREKGVTLLTVDFDEPLTEIHIRERLKEKSLI